MKRLIVLLFLSLFFLTSYAQTYRYRAQSYAFGERSSYTGNIIWGDWQKCRVIITIDFDEDYIEVYSSRTQNYVIVGVDRNYYDKDGAQVVDMSAIDEEGIECTVKLRVQRDGVAQLYSYYSDIAWVYSNLVRL